MTTQTQTAPAAKPANGSKPPVPPTAAADAAKSTNGTAEAKPAEGEASDETKTRVARKVYVALGEVREFKNAAEAEKFLNSDAAPKDFSVIKGLKIEQKKKVSLR